MFCFFSVKEKETHKLEIVYKLNVHLMYLLYVIHYTERSINDCCLLWPNVLIIIKGAKYNPSPQLPSNSSRIHCELRFHVSVDFLRLNSFVTRPGGTMAIVMAMTQKRLLMMFPFIHQQLFNEFRVGEAIVIASVRL